MISHCFQGFSSTSLVQSPCGLHRHCSLDLWPRLGLRRRWMRGSKHGFAMFHICSTCFSIFDIPLFHLFHTIRPTFCGNMADLGFCCLQDGVEDQDRDNDGVEDRMDRWTWPRVEWVAGRWNCLLRSECRKCRNH